MLFDDEPPLEFPKCRFVLWDRDGVGSSVQVVNVAEALTPVACTVRQHSSSNITFGLDSSDKITLNLGDSGESRTFWGAPSVYMETHSEEVVVNGSIEGGEMRFKEVPALVERGEAFGPIARSEPLFVSPTQRGVIDGDRVGGVEIGPLTLDAWRQAVCLRRTDPRCNHVPWVGAWVRGIEGVDVLQHPGVIGAMLSLIHAAAPHSHSPSFPPCKPSEIVTVADNTVLLAVYLTSDSKVATPRFYEASYHPSSPRSISTTIPLTSPPSILHAITLSPSLDEHKSKEQEEEGSGEDSVRREVEGGERDCVDNVVVMEVEEEEGGEVEEEEEEVGGEEEDVEGGEEEGSGERAGEMGVEEEKEREDERESLREEDMLLEAVVGEIGGQWEDNPTPLPPPPCPSAPLEKTAAIPPSRLPLLRWRKETHLPPLPHHVESSARPPSPPPTHSLSTSPPPPSHAESRQDEEKRLVGLEGDDEDGDGGGEEVVKKGDNLLLLTPLENLRASIQSLPRAPPPPQPPTIPTQPCSTTTASPQFSAIVVKSKHPAPPSPEDDASVTHSFSFPAFSEIRVPHPPSTQGRGQRVLSISTVESASTSSDMSVEEVVVDMELEEEQEDGGYGMEEKVVEDTKGDDIAWSLTDLLAVEVPKVHIPSMLHDL